MADHVFLFMERGAMAGRRVSSRLGCTAIAARRDDSGPTQQLLESV
jgi:hypothetical protein